MSTSSVALLIAPRRVDAGVVERSSLQQLAVQRRQEPGGLRWHQADMRNSLEVLGDRPEVVLTRHPVHPVEAAEVDRPAMTAQRTLGLEVEVVLQVRHGQFPRRSTDGPEVAPP